MSEELNRKNGTERCAARLFLLLDTESRMLHRPNCALTIDRRHPAALKLTIRHRHQS